MKSPESAEPERENCAACRNVRYSAFQPRSSATDPRAALPPDFRICLAAPADVDALAAIAHEREGGDLARHRARIGGELERIAGGEGRLLLIARTSDTAIALGRAFRFRHGDTREAGGRTDAERAQALPPAPRAPLVPLAPEGWYLGGVIVRPAWRRRGIGAALTAERLAWIAQRAGEAYYFVNARNRASIALHEPFGFVEVTRDFAFPGVTFEGGEGILFRAPLIGAARFVPPD